MSTGTKRMIWLIANVVIAGRQGASLIGVEEIETSIHPRMIQELLEIIDENLGNTGMIVTSHSPYLIQYLKPRCLYVGVPNEEGIASFKKVRDQAMPSLMKAARERGFGFGEYLFSLMSSDEDGALVCPLIWRIDMTGSVRTFERGIALIVEGATEKMFYQVYLERCCDACPPAHMDKELLDGDVCFVIRGCSHGERLVMFHSMDTITQMPNAGAWFNRACKGKFPGCSVECFSLL